MQSTFKAQDVSAETGKSIILTGSGSPVTRQAVRVGTACANQGVLDEMSGAICASYNQEDITMVRAHGKSLGLKVWHPSAPLPGKPNGFLGQAEKCLEARHLWLPDLEEYFADAAHRSAQHGLTVGGDIHVLSTGGHMTTANDDVRLGRHFFPDSLHIGILYLPTQKPGLWHNLVNFPEFPQELDMPIILMDNLHAVEINKAIPALIAGLASGYRYTSRSHEMPLEVLSQVTQNHKLLTVSSSTVQIPMINANLIGHIKKVLVGGTPEGVLEAQLPGKLGELLASLYSEESKLLSAPEPPADSIEFVSLGGMPRPNKGETRDEAKLKLETTVRELANRKLAKVGRHLPRGMNIIWSSFVTVDASHRFAEIQGIRLFRVYGKTARDYIDEMIH